MWVALVVGILAAGWFYFLAKAAGRNPLGWAGIALVVPILTFLLSFAPLLALFESFSAALALPSAIAAAVLVLLRAKFLQAAPPGDA